MMKGALWLVLLVAVWAMGAAQGQIQDINLDCVKPVYIIADDFNRDGYPDLAVACHSCDSVVVLPNQNPGAPGCSAFGPSVVWKLTDSPIALASGSFIDPPKATTFPYQSMFPNILAVTQYQPGLVRFCPVQPKAPFLDLVNSPDTLAIPSLPFATLTHLVVADFNNDGMLDVAVLDGLTPSIGFYTGTRDPIKPAVPSKHTPAWGTIPAGTAPAAAIPAPGTRAYFMIPGDFDRDGLEDLAVAVDGSVYFYKNNSKPSGPLAFAQTPTAKILLGVKVVGLAVADFNRDGYLDIAAVDPEFGALSIVLNRGCWNFDRPIRIKKAGEPVFVVALDCDRNGLIDLAVAEEATNKVEILLNRLACKEEDITRPVQCQFSSRDGTQPPSEDIDKIEFFRSHSYPVGPAPVSLAVGDFDLNGILDIAVALKGADGTAASPPPEVQVIYNPCCCPGCAGGVPCCGAGAQSERGVCPEKVGEPPKG